MRIINNTAYKTADLRTWLRAAHEAMGAPTDKDIYVKYSKHSMAWGCAAYAGYYMRLFLPGDPSKIGGNGRLAQLLEHEICHNLGLKHGDMHPSTFRGAPRDPGSWEEKLNLPTIREAKPKLTQNDRVEARAAKARKMLDRWERKFKLAKTIRAKWARKVRYYDKRRNAADTQ